MIVASCVDNPNIVVFGAVINRRKLTAHYFSQKDNNPKNPYKIANGTKKPLLALQPVSFDY
jgi:hypothetical protein